MTLVAGASRLLVGTGAVFIGRQLPRPWSFVAYGVGGLFGLLGLKALAETGSPLEDAPGGILEEVPNLPPPPQLGDVKAHIVAPGMLAQEHVSSFGDGVYLARVEWRNRAASSVTLQPVFTHKLSDQYGDNVPANLWAAPLLSLGPGETRLVDYEVPLQLPTFYFSQLVETYLTSTMAGLPDAQLDFKVWIAT